MPTTSTAGFYQLSADGATLNPLTLGGVMGADGILGPVSSYTTMRGTVAPPPPPGPTGTMTLGLGGGVGTLALMTQNVNELHAVGAYQYWTTAADYNWANMCSSFPDTFTFFIAASCTTLTAARDMLATFPATRPGKVYISFGQEQDNNAPYRTGVSPNFVYRGDLYVADSAPLRQAIDEAVAAGKTYLRKSVSLMPMTLFLAGDVAATFIAPGVTHLMMSYYAQMKIGVDGHTHWTRSPVDMPRRIGDYAASHGLEWDAAAAGYMIPDTHANDPLSLADAAGWMVDAAHNAYLHGAHFFGWFNTDWRPKLGDYRIQSFPALTNAWLSLLAEYGQWP